MITFWKVTCGGSVGAPVDYFTTIELVKASVAITYERWTTKPTIETERHDYVCWRVPNGDLIEAVAITAKDKPDHL